jgi:ribosomal protein S21
MPRIFDQGVVEVNERTGIKGALGILRNQMNKSGVFRELRIRRANPTKRLRKIAKEKQAAKRRKQREWRLKWRAKHRGRTW